VQEDSSNAVGTPYYSNRSPTTYSCVTDCTGTQYEVHVIGIYYNGVFRDQNVAVEMTVCGHSSKPLVLVLDFLSSTTLDSQCTQWGYY